MPFRWCMQVWGTWAKCGTGACTARHLRQAPPRTRLRGRGAEGGPDGDGPCHGAATILICMLLQPGARSAWPASCRPRPATPLRSQLRVRRPRALCCCLWGDPSWRPTAQCASSGLPRGLGGQPASPARGRLGLGPRVAEGPAGHDNGQCRLTIITPSRPAPLRAFQRFEQTDVHCAAVPTLPEIAPS